MSRKGIAVALIMGCVSAATQASTVVHQLNWPATASKETRMEISLTHPGLQSINAGQPAHPVHTLAANISHPDFNSTYQLQARTLYGRLSPQEGSQINLALNGQPLSATRPLTLAQATRYYLSYQADSAKPDQVGDAAYELMVYWLG